jgi:hypothetical protein
MPKPRWEIRRIVGFGVGFGWTGWRGSVYLERWGSGSSCSICRGSSRERTREVEEIVAPPPRDFSHLQAGDKVVRWLAGMVPVEQVVVKVDDVFIYTGDPDNGWRFEKSTGYEYDPDLPTPPGVIISWLAWSPPSSLRRT